MERCYDNVYKSVLRNRWYFIIFNYHLEGDERKRWLRHFYRSCHTGYEHRQLDRVLPLQYSLAMLLSKEDSNGRFGNASVKFDAYCCFYTNKLQCGHLGLSCPFPIEFLNLDRSHWLHPHQ